MIHPKKNLLQRIRCAITHLDMVVLDDINLTVSSIFSFFSSVECNDNLAVAAKPNKAPSCAQLLFCEAEILAIVKQQQIFDLVHSLLTYAGTIEQCCTMNLSPLRIFTHRSIRKDGNDDDGYLRWKNESI
jgi:hypothetical protein